MKARKVMRNILSKLYYAKKSRIINSCILMLICLMSNAHADTGSVNTNNNYEPGVFVPSYPNDSVKSPVLYIHVSRPDVGHIEQHLANMKRLESLLFKHTWFREGSTGGNFRNPGSFGEGMVERFGIDACVFELNSLWIEGLQKEPFGEDWELYGRQLRKVFYEY